MTIIIVTVVTVAVVKVVIVTSFSKEQLDTLTADEMFSVQLFVILAMFYNQICHYLGKRNHTIADLRYG